MFNQIVSSSFDLIHFIKALAINKNSNFKFFFDNQNRWDYNRHNHYDQLYLAL